MNRILGACVVSLTLASTTFAQLSNKEAPAVVGHFHLNVTSVEAHKRFWEDTLGGTALKLGPGNIDVIRFPDTLIFLRVQAPTGPSRGTAFDHIGFAGIDLGSLAVGGKLAQFPGGPFPNQNLVKVA